jgi:hypothetical protein
LFMVVAAASPSMLARSIEGDARTGLAAVKELQTSLTDCFHSCTAREKAWSACDVEQASFQTFLILLSLTLKRGDVSWQGLLTVCCTIATSALSWQQPSVVSLPDALPCPTEPCPAFLSPLGEETIQEQNLMVDSSTETDWGGEALTRSWSDEMRR